MCGCAFSAAIPKGREGLIDVLWTMQESWVVMDLAVPSKYTPKVQKSIVLWDGLALFTPSESFNLICSISQPIPFLAGSFLNGA